MRSVRADVPIGLYAPVLFLAAGILTALPGCSRATVEKDGGWEEIDFSTVDGFALVGTIRRVSDEAPPGLVLVHTLGADRHRWAHFADSAARTGYMSLAYDMRGHGESRRRNGKTVNFRSFHDSDWKAAVADIAAAKKALLEAGADPENIAIVGASIGANLALVYAKDDPQIQAVVLLSPGKNYRGLESAPPMSSFRERPVLIMAAEGDTYSASSGAELKKLSPGFSELRVYPGSAHGTDLLDAHVDATGQILLWLDAILEAKDVDVDP